MPPRRALPASGALARLALALAALCCLEARLPGVDELLAWDDLESYAAGTITTTAGSPYAGGDGWATSGGEVGWEVAMPSPISPTPTASIINPGLISGSSICLQTVNVTTLRRILRPLTPATGAPIWVSCLIKGNLMQDVAQAGQSPQNLIVFSNGLWTTSSFTINTLGTRVDGSTTTSEPIRWRLDQVDQPPSTTLEVDNTIHLLVLEVAASQLSLWIFARADPDPETLATMPAMATESLATPLPFDRIAFQVAVFPGDPATLSIDNIAIGTSELAVTTAGMPHVTGLAPVTGVVTGGDAIAISGTGFDLTSQASFGGDPATAMMQSGGTTLTCLSPASANGLGTVDLVVSNRVGSALHPQSFTYQAASAGDPSSTAPPTIDDSAGSGPGSAWLGSSGSWSPTPSGFTYAWQTSPDGSYADATVIGGATASTYTVASSDLGNWLRLAVTPAGTGHVAYSAFVQVSIPKGSGSGNGAASAGGSTGTTYASAVTSGTAGSSCGLGAGSAMLLPGVAWIAFTRRTRRRWKTARGASPA